MIDIETVRTAVTRTACRAAERPGGHIPRFAGIPDISNPNAVTVIIGPCSMSFATFIEHAIALYPDAPFIAAAAFGRILHVEGEDLASVTAVRIAERPDARHGVMTAVVPGQDATEGGKRMTSQRTSPELVWHNKEHSLVANGRDGYGWSFGAPGNADRSLQSAGWVGGGAEMPNGLLVVGDALDAMMALQAAPRDDLTVDGVRLVYIDPPFNTGQSFAQYEDALDHSTWLSMFRDRLLAVKPLLAPTASVWVHLDDAEAHHARCVLDEVFGADAFVATVIWQKRTTRESRTAFSSNHDYIHVYAPSGPKKWKLARNLLPRDPNSFRNRDGDPRGPWADAPFTAPGYRPNQQYEIINPAGMPLYPPKGRSWYATEPVYRRLEADNRLWFPKGGEGLPRMKLFPHEVQGLVPFSIWSAEEVGTNDDAKRQLMAMFPHLEAFATPKPERLLERIIHIATDPGDVVLDFFAGSGTTPAVAHKLGRKWVAVERSITTAADYIIPRLHRVIHGRDAGGISARPESSPGGRFEVLAVEGCGEHVAPNFLAERLSALHVTSFDPLPTVGAKRPGNRTKKVASAEVVTMPSLFDEPVVPGPVEGVDVWATP